LRQHRRITSTISMARDALICRRWCDCAGRIAERGRRDPIAVSDWPGLGESAYER
jgi:hypothetical protein